MKRLNLVGVLVFAWLLSACGYNTKAINDFNTGALSLTKSYGELMSRSVTWCYESTLYGKISSPEYTDLASMKSSIDQECKEFAADVKTAEASAVVVNAYAAALASLVGLSPQFIEDDTKNLGDALLTLKNADGSEKFDDAEIRALEKLTNTLSQMITSSAIEKKATELMRDNSAAVNRQVRVMQDVAKTAAGNTAWVTNLSRTNLLNNLDRVGGRMGGLQISNEEAIPARYLSYLLLKDEPSKEEVDEALTKFDEAATLFISANTDLEKRFSTLPKKEQLDAIVKLVEKSKDLRKSIKALDK